MLWSKVGDECAHGLLSCKWGHPRLKLISRQSRRAEWDLSGVGTWLGDQEQSSLESVISRGLLPIQRVLNTQESSRNVHWKIFAPEQRVRS